ncbi:MAG: hypothetical protein AAFX50_18100, partial [Acidobacteriota bacterium]
MHRAAGDGAATAADRPVPERPALDPRYAVRVESDGALLVDERGHAWVEGAIFSALLPELDGRRTVGGVIRDLGMSRGFGPAEVVAALVRLADAGYLGADPSPSPDGPALRSALRELGLGPFESSVGGEAAAPASVDLVCAAAEDARIAAARRSSGIAEGLDPSASVTLVVADDLLAPALGGVEDWLGQRQRPWLLVQPFGHRPTLGPLFGAGGCLRWRDLAEALGPQRVLERSLGVSAPRPSSDRSVGWALRLAAALAAASVTDPGSRGGELRRGILELDFEASRAALHPVARRGSRRTAESELPFALEPRPKIPDAAGGSRTTP